MAAMCRGGGKGRGDHILHIVVVTSLTAHSQENRASFLLKRFPTANRRRAGKGAGAECNHFAVPKTQ